MDSESFFETFLQAASCTRIQMHQFVIHRSGAFFDLAALNERGLPSMPRDRRMQILASSKTYSPGVLKS